jgi:hypothetical protein
MPEAQNILQPCIASQPQLGYQFSHRKLIAPVLRIAISVISFPFSSVLVLFPVLGLCAHLTSRFPGRAGSLYPNFSVAYPPIPMPQGKFSTIAIMADFWFGRLVSLVAILSSDNLSLCAAAPEQSYFLSHRCRACKPSLIFTP